MTDRLLNREDTQAIAARMPLPENLTPPLAAPVEPSLQGA
jgi:hypothetical protein